MIRGLSAETTSKREASVRPSRVNPLLRAAVVLVTTISWLRSMSSIADQLLRRFLAEPSLRLIEA